MIPEQEARLTSASTPKPINIFQQIMEKVQRQRGIVQELNGMFCVKMDSLVGPEPQSEDRIAGEHPSAPPPIEEVFNVLGTLDNELSRLGAQLGRINQLTGE